jgi:cytochrome P450
MRQILEQLWAGVEQDGRTESVAALAKPYPALTIAAILGAPAADAPRLHNWSTWVQRQFDIRALTTDLARIEAAVVEVYDYVEALLAGRPDPSTLLGALVAAEAEGERLSHPECVNLAVNVLAGAIDTTQSQLSHALHLFATHPDQWALLDTTLELVPAAVTEVLRMEPVTPFTARLCLEDVEYNGVVFPAGTIVAICAERANREGEGGERFNIAVGHGGRLLTFGAGPHYCLGANLARAELEEALRFLAPRMRRLDLDGPVSFGGIEGIYGIEAMSLHWSTAEV